jgi:transglutaminase-like putative cysteine protease
VKLELTNHPEEKTMNHPIPRRALLKAGAALSTASLSPFSLPVFAQERRFEPQLGNWRTFDVTITVEVADVKGATRLWLPVPTLDTEFQKSLDSSWTGNASSARLASDPARGVRMLYAEFAAGTATPMLSLTSRVQTRNRVVDWSRTAAANEDPAVLRTALSPTELLPLDGIVRDTARKATQGARTDVEKARAIYTWVVANSYREPKTRGCGSGDIKTLLETGNLGGKCADLNALFVGLCRASGVPARDLYGLRLAPSAFGYKELGANSSSLKGAQHCRAEVYLKQHGWVAMDPADVLKVMRQETPEWIKDTKNPVVAPVNASLFGRWEGNWVAWNNGHDIKLPGSVSKGTLPFLMYPNGENASGRFDELSPDSFKYKISAREIAA